MQGHTSFINSVRYLPSRNNEYILSASNDKEVNLPAPRPGEDAPNNALMTIVSVQHVVLYVNSDSVRHGRCGWQTW